LRAYFVTVGKNAKKLGLLGILTADVGGCTLMDADEFRLVWDTWVRLNRIFMGILRYCAKRWEKTRFLWFLTADFPANV